MRIVASFVEYGAGGVLVLVVWGFVADGLCSSMTEYTPSGATNVESFSIQREPVLAVVWPEMPRGCRGLALDGQVGYLNKQEINSEPDPIQHLLSTLPSTDKRHVASLHQVLGQNCSEVISSSPSPSFDYEFSSLLFT